MYKVDFVEVKNLATIEQICAWLGIELKQNRAQCPINQGENRELTIAPNWTHKDGTKGAFKCWPCNEGGDVIALVAHVRQITVRQAAEEIMKHFHGYSPAKKGLPPEGLDYLEYSEQVQALGLLEEKANELGIGFATKGTMRGHILFPMRDKTGKLKGYIGFKDGVIKLPSDFTVK